MAGGDGRVRREDRCVTHRGERIVEAHAFGDELVNPLQDHERRVPFVQMPDRRRNAERAQRANAADAQDDFLLQPGLAIAAVQAGREVAIPRRVLLEARIEQVQTHAADRHLPHVGQNRPIAERHGDDARCAVRLQRLLNGHVWPIEALVHLLAASLPGKPSDGSSPADT